MVPFTLLQRDTHNKHFVFWDIRESTIKPGFHIVVSDRVASQSVDRRCCWDAYDDMGTFFGDVADVPFEMGKVEISSTFDNVPDASMSYPRRYWDVPVTYYDMETRL